MAKRNYWLNLYTGTTWQEFLKAGGNVSGFRERRWNTLRKVKPGDYLLCYVTGISRFIGILEVTSKPYKATDEIWSVDTFPCRINVEIVIALEPETAVPIHSLHDELSIFEGYEDNPNSWTGYVRGSPTQWKEADGEAILQALREAEQSPVIRPVDEKKLQRRPRGFDSDIGVVTVPDAEDEAEEARPAKRTTTSNGEATKHTEIQHMLLKLGSDMGYDVWVGRNDKNKEFNGARFSERFKLLERLPRQFDDTTTKIIELIDVLWLRGNSFAAAFEIESTTSIYSGLLRMADLVAMQPNLKIPLYLVAPDDRRDKVLSEVNRPTFRRLSPPLVDIVRYISFSTLQKQLEAAAPFVSHLKASFIEEISEDCELEEG